MNALGLIRQFLQRVDQPAAFHFNRHQTLGQSMRLRNGL